MYLPRVRCEYPGCESDAVRGLVKGDAESPEEEYVLFRCEEHTREAEDIARIAALRPMGLIAYPVVRSVSLEEAIAIQVMGS